MSPCIEYKKCIKNPVDLFLFGPAMEHIIQLSIYVELRPLTAFIISIKQKQIYGHKVL